MQSACVMAKADYCLPWNGQPRYVRNSVTFFWLHLCSFAWWISPLGSRTEWFAFAVNEKSRNAGFVQELQVAIRFTLKLVLCFFLSAFHPGFWWGCWHSFWLAGTVFFLAFFLFFSFSFLTLSVLHPVIMTRGRRMDASSRWLLTQKTSVFCRYLYHEILCSLCQQVLVRCCSPFVSV